MSRQQSTKTKYGPFVCDTLGMQCTNVIKRKAARKWRKNIFRFGCRLLHSIKFLRWQNAVWYNEVVCTIWHDMIRFGSDWFMTFSGVCVYRCYVFVSMSNDNYNWFCLWKKKKKNKRITTVWTHVCVEKNPVFIKRVPPWAEKKNFCVLNKKVEKS